jgi:drug/metabolite transporter (DMT)-like permease
LALLTVLTYSCWNYSGAWVDGNLQQVLANLTFVFVFIFSVPVLGLRISKREALASLIIILGVLLGMYPAIHDIAVGVSDDDDTGASGSGEGAHEHPSWFNSWYFILLFIAAVMFQALGFVYQDRALRPPYNLEESSCLFWYSWYSIPPYILLIPMECLPEINATTEFTSFASTWTSQAGAFRCFIGKPNDDEYPTLCTTHDAWLWLMLYCISFVGFYYYSNVLFAQTSAFWTTLLQTLASPLSAVAFNFPQIVGSYNYTPFTGFAGGSFAIILVGVFVRGTPPSDEDPPSYNDKDERIALEGADTGSGERDPLLVNRSTAMLVDRCESEV